MAAGYAYPYAVARTLGPATRRRPALRDAYTSSRPADGTARQSWSSASYNRTAALNDRGRACFHHGLLDQPNRRSDSTMDP